MLTRRKFVGAAASTVAFGLLTDTLKGETKVSSKKLNIACIGVGVMGTVNLQNVSQSENIVAVCDVDLNRAQSVVNSFCPGARIYQDYRDMFAEMEHGIDAVVVSTPDHNHYGPVMAAIECGKHVYCEKPLAHSVYEVRKITEAARKRGVRTQMGIQSHSSVHMRRCLEWIWAGAIGEVNEIQTWCDRPQGGYTFPGSIMRPTEQPPVPDSLDWDLWLGPADYRPYHPLYTPILWRGWLDFGTGSLGDMGCHIFDAPFWAMDLGSPTSVEASVCYNPDMEFWRQKVASATQSDFSDRWGQWNRGIKESISEMKKETFPASSMVTYEFPAREGRPPLKMTWCDGGILPAKPYVYPADQPLNDKGAFFYGSDGVMMYCHSGPMKGFKLFPESKMDHWKRNQPPKTIENVSGPYTDWIEACKGGKPSSANFDYSGPLTEMVLLGVIALQVPNQKLLWDGSSMSFTNSEQANSYVKPSYRKGWKL